MKGDDAFGIFQVEERFETIPLALNMDQVRQYNPPTNPAKIKDPRANWYIEKYGEYSWELDALRPEVLRDIIERGIQEHLDIEKYNAWIAREKPLKQKLQDFADSLVNESEDEHELPLGVTRHRNRHQKRNKYGTTKRTHIRNRKHNQPAHGSRGTGR